MTLPDVGTLPPGYELRRADRGLVAWLPQWAHALEEAGLGPASRGAPPGFRTSDRAGRRPLGELEVPEGRVLLRSFSHGGLLRGLTGRRFADPTRPFLELCLSSELTARGIPTPRVVAARARRAPGWGWELDLVTECIQDSIDLGYVLAMARDGGLEPRTRHAILSGAGAFVASLHAAGLHHVDLQPNNILVNRGSLEGGPPHFWILDLDRSERLEELPEELRRSSLARLWRFVARAEERHGRALSRADRLRFLRGYEGVGDGWKGHWRAVDRRTSRRSAWHRIGWWLESAFGGRRDDHRSGASRSHG